jgi:undecaprenyl-phosphate 4-deoxy-4-formamido-L-arabinose transferase
MIPYYSIVIPVYNENAVLDELIDRLLTSCQLLEQPFEVLLVDDGSRDGSTQKITAAAQRFGPQIVGVLLNRNYGQHAAVMAGFAQTRGEVVVTLDADLQNPPEEIPRLVEAIEAGADVVGTVRVDRRDSLFRKLASRIVNYAAQKTTGVYMRDYGCMLRAYRRSIVEAMLRCHERSTFIPILANSFAAHTTEIEVRHAERSRGDSKYSLWRLINLQFDLLTSMTTLPIRLLSMIGVVLSLAGMLVGVILLAGRLIYGSEWAVQGVMTVMAGLFFFMGVQLIGMGLLGEYIGRIYHDVRARPRYFVWQVVGRATDTATERSTIPETSVEIQA